MVNERLVADLHKLGIEEGDTVLVHSSLSSLGYVDGGAETVIDSLLEAVKEGTLLMPSLTYASSGKTHHFSVKDTPSCVGAISECFRQRPDVIRSVHPTHSVCGKGKYAKELLSEHIDTNTPAGGKSPYALLPKYHGKILMLGCGLKPNTSMHAVEEVVKTWYVLKDTPSEFTLVDSQGNSTEKSYFCHDFSKVWQRYDRLAELMDIPSGKVLEADCYLIPTREMWETAIRKLKENEDFFVDMK